MRASLPAAARARHDVARIPHHPRVVHHHASRLLGEEGLREEAHDVFAGHELPVAVEEEAAVEVAVEGHAEVGALRQDRLGGCGVVLGEEGVRDAVREGRVRRVVHPHEVERRPRCGEPSGDRVEGGAGCAVAGVDHHREGAECGQVDGVVGRRHLNPAAGAKLGHGPVHFLGAREANPGHVGAGVAGAERDGGGVARTRRPRVVADGQGGCPQVLRGADAAANVVGLETCEAAVGHSIPNL